MKVKMLTTSAGPDGVRVPGQVVEVDKDEAKTLIEGGYAEAVEEPNHTEEEEKPADDQEQPEEEEKPKRGGRK